MLSIAVTYFQTFFNMVCFLRDLLMRQFASVKKQEGFINEESTIYKGLHRVTV